MKRYPYNLLAALILLSFAGTAISQSQSDEAARDTTATGTLSGRVVNENGQPVANALVTVRSYGASNEQNTTTDNEGSFQVTGLKPAAYLVNAAAPAYVQAPRDPDINPIGYYRLGDSVRIEIIRGGVITGTVTRSTGEPVVGLTVRAAMIRDTRGKPSPYGGTSRGQTTDDRGVYRIFGLPPGTYVVSTGGGRSFGYAVDPYDNDVPTYAPSTTRDGATEIFVGAGAETANVDIRYRGEPGHAVSGTAKSTITAEQPTGFNITLNSVFNGASQSGYSVFQPPNSRAFAFKGVADGEYDLIAQSYLPGGFVFSEPIRIKVRGADVTGIELTAKPLGSIKGTIVLEESKVPECEGKRRLIFGETVVGPWHNEKIVAKDQPQFVWGFGGPVVPDKEGNFTLGNLAPGQYRFNVRPMSRYWYLKSVAWSSPTAPKAQQVNRPADAARNWTTLGSGDRMSGLIITMALGAGSIDGQIDLGEGQKLPPRLFAYLVPAEREKANDVLRYFTSMVALDGSFKLNNLPPGRYWVIAQPATENESNIFSKLRLPDETDMRAKLLRDAEAAKIETELKPCQNVSAFRLPLR